MAQKELAEFSLEDGTTFLVEVEEPEETASLERIDRQDRRIYKAKEKFEKTLDNIKPVASTIVSKFRDLNTPASEVEVKFGLKLTADAGAIFSSVGGEASYEITLKWQQSNQQSQQQ